MNKSHTIGGKMGGIMSIKKRLN